MARVSSLAMKALLLIFTALTLSLKLLALELPHDHFLAPRDYEVMWLAGIESPVSVSQMRMALKKCEQQTTYTVINFDTCSWIEAMKNAEVKSLSSYQFGTQAQITFFGERHISPDVQLNMATIINQAGPNQVHALALEMFNENSQAYLDAYLADEINDNEIRAVLTSAWNYNSDGYMEILKAAKKKGLKLIALDDRDLFAQDSFSDNLKNRDEQMGQVLIEYLTRNPSHQIWVYSGKLHAFKSMGRRPQIATIADHLKNWKSDLSTAHYLFFGKKESALLPLSFKLISGSEEKVVLRSPEIAPYIDGAIFLSP